MAKNAEPVVLDLATLPRDQMGPFLILGLDKAADKEEMESHWADRVKWARKGLLKVPLEDVNWDRDAECRNYASREFEGHMARAHRSRFSSAKRAPDIHGRSAISS